LRPIRKERYSSKVRSFFGFLPVFLGCASLPPPAQYSGVFSEAKGVLVVYGDTRRLRFGESLVESTRQRADRERQEVARKVAEESPDIVLHSGDLVKNGGDREEWAIFDRETTAIRERGIAVYPALGNHDYEGDGTANFFARFPHLGGRKWYDLRYRGLLILVVDSNRNYLTRSEIEGQRKWYRERLSAAQSDGAIRCIMVIGHHAPYTNAVVFSDSEFVKEEFVEPAKRFPKLRAFFVGHIHSYERFLIEGVHYVVSGGGGAPMNEVRTGRRHADAYSGPRRFHYCRIRAGDTVQVEVIMLGEDGKWFQADSFAIFP